MTTSIRDARALHVASVLLVAATAALVELAKGKPDPLDPMAWDDDESWQVFMHLRATIEAANDQHAFSSPLRIKNCHSCRHHLGLKHGAGEHPPVDNDTDSNMGFCGRSPPVHVTLPGRSISDTPHSSWPAVHGHHRCSEWQSIVGWTVRL